MHTSKLLLNMRRGGLSPTEWKKQSQQMPQKLNTSVCCHNRICHCVMPHVYRRPPPFLLLHWHNSDASCTFGLSLVRSQGCTCYSEAGAGPFIHTPMHTKHTVRYGDAICKGRPHLTVHWTRAPAEIRRAERCKSEWSGLNWLLHQSRTLSEIKSCTYEEEWEEFNVLSHETKQNWSS